MPENTKCKLGKLKNINVILGMFLTLYILDVM